jgi:magnesium dechelatase
MPRLNSSLLHLQFLDGSNETGPLSPRVYTLTHSDITGELFLTIGKKINLPQISGIYTRIMRDEVVAEWEGAEPATLHVYCHVSGGLVLGTPGMRYHIFRFHMPMVLEAFCYGDRVLLKEHPELAKGRVMVHFLACLKRFDKDVVWGVLQDYQDKYNKE